jgi:hypothetical protein
MAAAVGSVRIKLHSQPYVKRVGLWPMLIVVAFAWGFDLMWLFVACWTFQFNAYWAVTLLGATVAFGSCLSFMSWKMFTDAYREFDLELTDEEVVLSVIDRFRKKKAVQMVLLDDVKYAEYYSFQDSASIILHADYADMEVPLWPMGTTGRDVVDFLNGRGVTVVDVQFDDKVPD